MPVIVTPASDTFPAFEPPTVRSAYPPGAVDASGGAHLLLQLFGDKSTANGYAEVVVVGWSSNGAGAKFPRMLGGVSGQLSDHAGAEGLTPSENDRWATSLESTGLAEIVGSGNGPATAHIPLLGCDRYEVVVVNRGAAKLGWTTQVIGVPEAD